MKPTLISKKIDDYKWYNRLILSILNRSGMEQIISI